MFKKTLIANRGEIACRIICAVLYAAATSRRTASPHFASA